MSQESHPPKLVLAGPVGVGKTTAIRAITDGAPVSTDVPSSAGTIEGKSTTTVAMDFAPVRLDDGSSVMVYGLPGQEHYAFMRPIVLGGALGVLVLLDGRQPDLVGTCAHWLASVENHAPDAAVVIGITHTDLLADFSLTPIRRAVRDAKRPIPVFTFDARDRPQTLQLVRALLVSIH